MSSSLGVRFGAPMLLSSLIAIALACAAAPPAEAKPIMSAPSSVSSTIESVVLPVAAGVVFDPAVIGGALALGVLLFVRKNAVRGAQVEKAITWAFNIVEDLKQQGRLPPGADKIALALEQLEAILTMKGITLSDAEKELAARVWSAMHGASNAPLPTRKPALGFARLGVLAVAASLGFGVLVFSASSCSLFKPSLRADEVNCAAPTLLSDLEILYPDVMLALAGKGETGNIDADFAKIEASAPDVAICGALKALQDFDPSGATAPADAGAPAVAIAASPAALRMATVRAAPAATETPPRVSNRLLVAGQARRILGSRPLHPVRVGGNG